MSKDYLDRLNETLRQVHAQQPTLFQGYNVDVIHRILLKRIKHHFDFHELSNLLSLGGVRIIRFNRDKTEARHIQRLTLLFHRVLCSRTSMETGMLKATIQNLDLNQSILMARQHIRTGLAYLQDDSRWAREVPMRYGGKLVHYYNQGKDKRLEQVDFTENGWCLGMSVDWLARKYSKQEFWGEHESAGASRYRFVMAAQSVRTKGLHGAGVEDRAEFRLKRLGLEMKSITQSGGNPRPEMLAQAIRDSSVSYCRIGQYYKKGGGHAMAACQEKGGISFMDPNLGEFFFASPSRFVEWYPVFTTFMDYRYARFYVEHYQGSRGTISPDLATALRNRRKAMGY